MLHKLYALVFYSLSLNIPVIKKRKKIFPMKKLHIKGIFYFKQYLQKKREIFNTKKSLKKVFQNHKHRKKMFNCLINVN